MEWPPHITVATIVQQRDKFLMVEEQQAGVTVINQPAGHLEPGESLASAAIRETLEETRWHVKLMHIVGIYHYLHPQTLTTYHRITYAANAVVETDGVLDKDITQVLWLTADEIFSSHYTLRASVVAECLHDHLAGKHYPLDLIKTGF